MTLPHLHRLAESYESNPHPRQYEHGGELRVPDNVQDTTRRDKDRSAAPVWNPTDSDRRTTTKRNVSTQIIRPD
jgi:hypothetical protein